MYYTSVSSCLLQTLKRYIEKQIPSTVYCLTAKNAHLAKNHITDKSKLLTWNRKIKSVCWPVKQSQVNILKIADVLISKHSANHA